MLKNPQKADLDKDGKLSSYEKKRGKAIESNMEQKPIKAVLGVAAMGLLGAKYLSKKKKASAKPKDDSESLLPIEKLEGKDQKKTQQLMASKGKMMKARVGRSVETSGMKKIKAEDIRKNKIRKARKEGIGVADEAKMNMGGEMRGYGAARTSGMGLQDEQLVPGKSLDYYKDLM